MTYDELVARYQVIRDVSEGPPGRLRTLLAWPRVGEKVMIHFLEGPPADNARLLAMIDRLGPPDRDAVLERLEVDGEPVVITKFLDKRRTLKQWLDTTVDPPPVAESRPIDQVSGPAPDQSASPGEVTVLFGPQSGAGRFPAPRPPPPAPSAAGDGRAPEPVQPREPDQAPQPSQAPGEFTQLFGPGSGSGPPVIRKAPSLGPLRKDSDLGVVPVGPSPGSVPNPPDERQTADFEPLTVPPSPQGAVPGEVTRLFQGHIGASVPPAGSRRPPPVPKPVPKVSDQGAVPPPQGVPPGELTQMLEGYAGRADPPAGPPKAAALDSALEPHQISWLGPDLANGPLFRSDPAPSRPAAGEVDYLERLAAPPRGHGAPARPLREQPPAHARPDPFSVRDYPPVPPPDSPSPSRVPDAPVEVNPPGGTMWYVIGLVLVVVVAIVLLIVVLS